MARRSVFITGPWQDKDTVTALRQKFLEAGWDSYDWLSAEHQHRTKPEQMVAIAEAMRKAAYYVHLTAPVSYVQASYLMWALAGSFQIPVLFIDPEKHTRALESGDPEVVKQWGAALPLVLRNLYGNVILTPNCQWVEKIEELDMTVLS